jgi:hypothetical protein
MINSRSHFRSHGQSWEETLFLFVLLLLYFSLWILSTDKGDEIDNKNPPLVSDILIALSKFW